MYEKTFKRFRLHRKTLPHQIYCTRVLDIPKLNAPGIGKKKEAGRRKKKGWGAGVNIHVRYHALRCDAMRAGGGAAKEEGYCLYFHLLT